MNLLISKNDADKLYDLLNDYWTENSGFSRESKIGIDEANFVQRLQNSLLDIL